MTPDDEPSPAARGLARARRIGGSPARSAPVRPPDDDVAPVLAEGQRSLSLEPRPSRAGRNLPAAIGVGVGLGALVLLSLLVYRVSFAVIVGVAVLGATFELSRVMGTIGVRPAALPLLVGGLGCLIAAWLRGPNGLVAGIMLTACAVLVWRLRAGAEGYARDVGASLFVVLYVPTLAGFAVLSAHADDGAARIIAFVATVVCSDTGGYVSGVFLGRHPLAPIVSKAKTWEGFAGSVLFCCVAGVLFLTLTFHESWWTGVLFGLAIVVTATLGDLGESLLKRDLGVKDMGSLLPGHGGLMDRLDSLLPCAAVAYLLLSAFAPAG